MKDVETPEWRRFSRALILAAIAIGFFVAKAVYDHTSDGLRSGNLEVAFYIIEVMLLGSAFLDGMYVILEMQLRSFEIEVRKTKKIVKRAQVDYRLLLDRVLHFRHLSEALQRKAGRAMLFEYAIYLEKQFQKTFEHVREGELRSPRPDIYGFMAVVGHVVESELVCSTIMDPDWFLTKEGKKYIRAQEVTMKQLWERAKKQFGESEDVSGKSRSADESAVIGVSALSWRRYFIFERRDAEDVDFCVNLMKVVKAQNQNGFHVVVVQTESKKDEYDAGILDFGLYALRSRINWRKVSGRNVGSILYVSCFIEQEQPCLSNKEITDLIGYFKRLDNLSVGAESGSSIERLLIANLGAYDIENNCSNKDNSEKGLFELKQYLEDICPQYRNENSSFDMEVAESNESAVEKAVITPPDSSE